MKALNTSNETVLALGANFSHSADSHLVAMQVEAFTIFLHFVLFDIMCLPIYSIVLLRGRMAATKHKQSIYRTKNVWSLEQGIDNDSIPQMNF